MIEEGGLKKEDDLCDDEQVQYNFLSGFIGA